MHAASLQLDTPGQIAALCQRRQLFPAFQLCFCPKALLYLPYTGLTGLATAERVLAAIDQAA